MLFALLRELLEPDPDNTGVGKRNGFIFLLYNSVQNEEISPKV
jgi:hypothetical protein